MEKAFKRIRIPATITTIIIFILLGAANGILGDLGTSFYQWFLQVVMNFITSASWLWIVILALSAILVFLLVKWQLTRSALEQTQKEALDATRTLQTSLEQTQKEALETAKTLQITATSLEMTRRLVEFDDWLQWLVPNLVSAQDLDSEMQRLIYHLLQRVSGLFEEPIRAAIFLPDSERKELSIKYSYMMPAESIQRTRFSVEQGKTNIKIGIAGEAFLGEDCLPLVAHVRREHNQWKTDKEDNYVFFDRKQPSLQYQSFVCIPICIGEGPANNLGVLCLDSQSFVIFDAAAEEDSETQKRLIKVASRFAAALQIYQQLKHIQ